jgi:hypothetical protein
MGKMKFAASIFRVVNGEEEMYNAAAKASNST